MNILHAVIITFSLVSNFVFTTPLFVQSPVKNVVSLELEEQVTGQYFYINLESPERYVLLRKAGHSAIGVDGRRNQLICFRGFVEGDRIINASRVFPPYTPDSRWESSRSGAPIPLSQYDLIDQQPSEEQAETLKKCLEFFSR